MKKFLQSKSATGFDQVKLFPLKFPFQTFVTLEASKTGICYQQSHSFKLYVVVSGYLANANLNTGQL